MGFVYAKLRTEWVSAPVLSHKIGPAGLDGRIESVQVHGKGVRVVLGAVASRRFRGDVPARVRVSIRAANDVLVPGNWIHLTAILMPPPGPAAPGGYDFGRAAFFDRIGAVGYAYGRASPIAPLREETVGERIATAIALLRWRMTERIQAALPGSTGGIASALITGDRGSISEDDEAALRDAGLAHVLAIAGLHMALVGLGLFWIVRALLAAIPIIALNHPIKKWAAVAALGGATFYLIISGAATPATRAYIMLATMLTAILMDRPALSMRSVALAAMIILLLRPESLIEPGFQMSFAAVVGLVAVAEWEASRRSHEGTGPRAFAGVRRYMRGIAITSFVGSIATAPYAVFHFDRATHYAVLGNLLAMPVMGFVTMPTAAITVMAMPFHLEAWPLKVMGFGIGIMLSMGRFVSGLPGAISAVAGVAGQRDRAHVAGRIVDGTVAAQLALAWRVACRRRRRRCVPRARTGSSGGARCVDGCGSRKRRRAPAGARRARRLLGGRMAEARRRRARFRCGCRDAQERRQLRRLWLHCEGQGRNADRGRRAHRCSRRGLRDTLPSSSAPFRRAAAAPARNSWSTNSISRAPAATPSGLVRRCTSKRSRASAVRGPGA